MARPSRRRALAIHPHGVNSQPARQRPSAPPITRSNPYDHSVICCDVGWLSHHRAGTSANRRTHVGDLNRFLGGWSGYFRYGNSTVQFDQITRHADTRLALWVAKRHQQHRR